MAKRIDPDLIARLSAEFEPALRKAFLDAIEQVTSNADIEALTKALKAGNVEAAIDAVGLDPRDLQGLSRAIDRTFDAGGSGMSEALNKAKPAAHKAVFRFDLRHPVAEAWLKNHSSTLIKEITEDTRKLIRVNLTDALEIGTGPRTTALDLVGRINTKTRKRQGGLIGLHSRMERAANKYAIAVRSADPEQLQYALSLELRDKRFDGSVRKALRTGQPINAKTAKTMAMQYRNKALRLRGETIARTETLRALAESRRQSMGQAIDDGSITATQIKRYWLNAGDHRVRHEHVEIPKMNAKGVLMDESFMGPNGPVKSAPDGVNCRCIEQYDVDFLADLD